MDNLNMPINEKIGVYVEINEKKQIIKVFSDLFEQPTPTSIKIDEGFGDKFAHAQSQYFAKPISDENGIYNYAYENGVVKEADKKAETQEKDKQARIVELKSLLRESDYKALKYAEGFFTEEEYEETKQQRQAWRDEINELENEIIELKL